MKTNELIQQLSSKNMPIRRLHPPVVRLWCWLTASLASIGCWIWFFGVRPELGSVMRNLSFWAESTPVLLISILAGYVALALGVPGSTTTKQLKKLCLFSLAVSLVSFTGGISYRIGERHSPWEAGPGALCLESIFELSLVPIILLFWMIRRALPTNPGWNGGVALFASASLAAWGTQWICPFEFPLHFLAWHLVPAWLLGFLGYWIGLKVLTWRPRISKK